MSSITIRPTLQVKLLLFPAEAPSLEKFDNKHMDYVLPSLHPVRLRTVCITWPVCFG
jgi:hypothetical protein